MKKRTTPKPKKAAKAEKPAAKPAKGAKTKTAVKAGFYSPADKSLNFL